MPPPAPLLYSSAAISVRMRGPWLDFETARSFSTLAHSDLFSTEVDDSILRIRGTFQQIDDLQVRRIGPLPRADLEALHAKLATTYRLPRTVTRVDAALLAANPARYHGQWLELDAIWESAFECSRVADLWFVPLREFQRAHGVSAWRIVGRVECEPGGSTYGHLGASRGTLKALAMTPAPRG